MLYAISRGVRLGRQHRSTTGSTVISPENTTRVGKGPLPPMRVTIPNPVTGAMLLRATGLRFPTCSILWNGSFAHLAIPSEVVFIFKFKTARMAHFRGFAEADGPISGGLQLEGYVFSLEVPLPSSGSTAAGDGAAHRPLPPPFMLVLHEQHRERTRGHYNTPHSCAVAFVWTPAGSYWRV